MPTAISYEDMKTKKRKTNLSEQLRAAFAESGLSRFELAKRAGVPYSGLHRFIAGERDIVLDTASRLCDVLGLELLPMKTKRKGR